MASCASNLNTLQSEEASKISHNLMATTVGDATTPLQPRHEASSVPWEASEPTPNRPEWLPEGWEMKVINRRNGKTAGAKDKFYYDPIFHHRFRSRKEVEYFLQTGMMRRSTPRSETSTTNRTSAQRFDFNNPPSKVSWVLNNHSKGSWTPFINNEEQPESAKRLWATTMEDICNNAYKSQGLESMHFRVRSIITLKSDYVKTYKGDPEILIVCSFLHMLGMFREPISTQLTNVPGQDSTGMHNSQGIFFT